MGNIPNVEDGTVYAIEPDPEMIQTIQDMMITLNEDNRDYAEIKDYTAGRHVLPNVPKTARVEVHEIAKRSTLNLIPLLISIPSQISFIDGYRVGEDLAPPEWSCWERSGMASKQTMAFKASLKYGHAFLALEELHGDAPKPVLRLLSTADTIAYYHDPVNDKFPAYAMTIRYRPKGDNPGKVVYYDDTAITYLDWYLGDDGDEFRNAQPFPHGVGQTPVGRLVCQMDDEGEVTGIVKPMIPVQDRVNQSAFDLLVTQTFSSFKVRWASGMLGDPVYEDEAKTIPKRDEDGNQIYRPIPIDQSTWVTTDDPSSKFGTLDETPLQGFLESLEAAIRQFAVVGQLPPHSLLGNMSNLSAETLVAAMSQTQRFAHMLKTAWGQVIVDLLGLASIAMGQRDNLEEYEGEVRWRDMSDHTMAAVVDALGKGVQMLNIPHESLWRRFPGVTQGEVMEWEQAAREREARGEFDEQSTPQGSLRREGAQAPADGGAPPVPTPLEAFGAAAPAVQ